MGEGHDHTTPYTPYDFPAGNARYIASPSYTPNMVVGARSRTGIVTCCDARCSPEHYFDMDINEAFVIRNGGGRTAEESVIRTLALIQVLSEVKEVMVVHHTGLLPLCPREWQTANVGEWKTAAPSPTQTPGSAK
jgi:hypothetical protein